MIQDRVVQVAKIIANKVALVARPDSLHEATDGSIGVLMLEKVRE